MQADCPSEKHTNNFSEITDLAEVERRKILTEKVWQIFCTGHERQTPQNKNGPQIDRALQRFRNDAIPGREEELFCHVKKIMSHTAAKM